MISWPAFSFLQSKFDMSSGKHLFPTSEAKNQRDLEELCLADINEKSLLDADPCLTSGSQVQSLPELNRDSES